MSTKAVRLTKICFRAGQAVCVLLALLFATQIVAGVVWLLVGDPASLHPAGVVVTPEPLVLQIPNVIMFAISRVLVFVLLLQLFRLLGSLARGETFASGTVQRMYRVGFLVIAAGIAVNSVMLLRWALAAIGVLDPQYAGFYPTLSLFTPLTGPLMVGGAVLLGARLLDEARKLRDETDQLRRDAELVV